MKKPLIIAIAAIVVSLLIGFALWSLLGGAKEVEAITIKKGAAERILAVNGRIRPRLEVDVRPQLGGTLVALPFDVGAQVSQGQLIARIDDAPEIASIAEAQAAADTQAATLAQARRDYARFAALGEFVSKRDLEQRRLDVVEGERELARRKAAIVQAQETRGRRLIRAPFSGVIMERPVDPGQTVGMDSIIYRLADLTNPQITVEIDEIYAAEVRQGMAAEVRLPSDKAPRAASIVHVEPRVDTTTGARNARIELSSPLVDAPAGLTVAVNLVVERRNDAISIPRSAIANVAGKSIVRIIGSDGRIADRAIRFLDWPSDQVIVTTGLKEGERLLLQADAAQSGDKVRLSDKK